MTDLSIEGLSKTLDSRAVLQNLNLNVTSGSLVAILGASGSGKTTLLRCVCGFERPDKGTIRIGGSLVAGPGTHVPPQRRHIGYVAQEGALFPHLNVADNITFALPRSLRRARYRVDELLELVGLAVAYASRAPQQLSGGEQQRVALARALASKPALVLLDEPFSSLDAALRIETREAVAAALSASGATGLLVTHDQAEALSIGHQVAVLREGRLVQVTTPQTLYRNPVDADLAQFIGEAVLLPGFAKDGAVACQLGRMKLAVPVKSGEVDLLIRPEQVRLHRDGEGKGLRGRVEAVTYYGHDARVRLSLVDTAPPVVLTARVFGHRCPKPGDWAEVEIEGEVIAYPRGLPAPVNETGD